MNSITRMLSAALLLALFAGPILGQSGADRAAVEKTVGYYITGLDTPDAESLRKAFAPEARMTHALEGTLVVVPIEDFIKRVGDMAGKARTGPAPNWRKITRVDVFGNMAAVQVESDFAELTLVDYLTLLKIGGEWKIVNKSFHRTPKTK